MTPVSVEHIREGIRRLDLAGRAICVHSSLRSFGGLLGGPSSVLDALLAEQCTVLVPAFSYEHEALPPPGVEYERNAYQAPDKDGIPFDPDANECSEGMGVLPRTVLAIPGRVRGNHPWSSFAAIGPTARQLISGQTPVEVYAPLEELAAVGGSVLLMGVGLDRMTLIHLAEARTGRQLFRRWVLDPAGEVVESLIGGHAGGFVNLDPILREIERRTEVGASMWRAFSAREALELATEAIRRTPSITHCEEECARCDASIAGGPIVQS